MVIMWRGPVAALLITAIVGGSSVPRVALAASSSFSQGFSYQGRLLTPDGAAPMTGLVDLTLGIYSMDGSCLLYEEKQAGIDLDESSGFFSVQVGSAGADPKRTGRDPGKTLASIFANGAQLRADHSTCPGGYTPAAGESRRLRVTVQPQGGSPETLSPDLTVSPAPQSFVAETLQGLTPDNLIQAKTTVTQTALGALTAGASSDASALHNHDGQYAKLSNSSSITLGSGQVLGLGSNNGTPTGVRVGDTWFDSSDNTMKYWDGTQAVSVGSAAGAVTSFNSRTGAVTLSDSDVTAALGFTPANASTMTTALAGKEPVITAGTSSQYLKGDKSLGSFNADVRGAIGVAGPLSYDLTSGTLSMVNQGSSTTVLHGNGSGQPSFSAIVEGDLGLSDVITGNATTARHGFLPKLGSGTTNFLREDGTWAPLPAGIDLTTSLSFGTAAAGTVTLGKAGQSTVLNGSVSVGSLKVADGTQGAGKVLTSDADGAASWVTPTSVDVAASTGFGTTAAGTVTIGKDGINTVLNGNVGIGAASTGAKLEVTGANGATLKIVDTNQGAGKVLTSDADGVASWAALPSAPVASVAGKTGVVTLSSGDISGLGAAATSSVGNLTEATSSVLTITGGASSVLGSGTSIQVKQASSTTSGYLSSADWNTFNNKQSAITAGTTAQYLRGDKSLSSFDADARAALSALGPIDYNFTTGAISMLNKGTTTTVLHGNASGQPSFSSIVEGDLSLSDVITGNATTARHGFLPKLGGGTTNFLREDGTWAAPAGGVDLTTATSFGTAAAGTVTIGKAGVSTAINGNVGLGTSAPLIKLDARGTSAKATTAVVENILQVASSDAISPLALRLGIKTDAGASSRYGAIEVDEGGTKRNLIIQSGGGNVGIGIVDPKTVLEVNGTARISHATQPALQFYSSSSAFTITKDDSNLSVRNGFLSDTPVITVTSAGTVGIGTTGPGEKLEVNGNVKATAFVSTSDRRLKRDIAAIQDPLERVLRLTGATYNWKASGRPDMGLIAQNVEENFPELVATDSNGFKAVKYGNVVAPVIEALKEFWHKFTDDSDRKAREIAELKARVELLERRLEALEAKDGATEKK